MKLNPDCMREVLLAVEERPFGDSYRINELADKIKDYDQWDIEYSCLKLYEAEFLDVLTARQMGSSSPYVVAVHDITYKGHLFLEKIRDNGIWSETKEKAKAVGAVAVDVLAQIAANIITSKLGF